MHLVSNFYIKFPHECIWSHATRQHQCIMYIALDSVNAVTLLINSLQSVDLLLLLNTIFPRNVKMVRSSIHQSLSILCLSIVNSCDLKLL